MVPQELEENAITSIISNNQPHQVELSEKLNSSEIRHNIILDYYLRAKDFLENISLNNLARHKLIKIRDEKGYDAAGLEADGSNGTERVKEMAKSDPEFEPQRQKIQLLRSRISGNDIEGQLRVARLSQEKEKKIRAEARLIGAIQQIRTSHNQKLETIKGNVAEIQKGLTTTPEEEKEATAASNRAVRKEQDTALILKNIYGVDKPVTAMQGEWFRSGYAEQAYRTILEAYFTEPDPAKRIQIMLLCTHHNLGIDTVTLSQIKNMADDLHTKVDRALKATNLQKLKDSASKDDVFDVEKQLNLGITRKDIVWI